MPGGRFGEIGPLSLPQDTCPHHFTADPGAPEPTVVCKEHSEPAAHPLSFNFYP